jgi:hypothetical protein
VVFDLPRTVIEPLERTLRLGEKSLTGQPFKLKTETLISRNSLRRGSDANKEAPKSIKQLAR